VTLDGLREICKALPGAAEDVKWGHDLCFCVGGKMFAAVNLEPPHQLGFKCSPEDFAELTEREGIVPAPYLARAMWVQETELGIALERQELTVLLRSAYDLVAAKLPKSRQPGATRSAETKRAGSRRKAAARTRASKARRTSKRR
jgi:predicted DNA-binding protein (MmcQ/YjbR family)